MSDEVRVRPARGDDLPVLAGVLTAAFAHDPYMSYLAGEASERNQRMRDGWLGILRFASAGLAATMTTDDRAGVAIWIPPGRRASGLLDGFRQLPSLTRLTGWGRLREVAAAVELLEHRRRAHLPEPHWYLSAIGVAPERQGRGVGSALMRPILERADAASEAAYLETAVARNVLIYERLGFEVVEELILPRTDVRGWLMLRRPAASVAASAKARRAHPNPTGSG